MRHPNIQFKRGFTFVELIVGIAVSAVILLGAYGAFQSLFTVVSNSRAKIAATDLSNEQFEIIRNLPYANVGIINGIPSGLLSHVQTIVRDGFNFTVTTYVRYIDDPFDGTIGGTPNDTSPDDYKLVELDLACSNCRGFSPVDVSTTVSPKNVETASNNGALFVQVLDAAGNPIPQANVHIENDTTNPDTIIDDVTNNQGLLEEVDVPPGDSIYQISATKSGYSTDITYPVTVTNPHPTDPQATVILQQISQVSFIIDKLSSFSVSSVLSSCAAAPNVHFTLQGAKLIGTNPSLLKYSQNKTTDGGGNLTIPNVEWDSYTFLNNDTSYDLIGVNPLSPVSLSPNSSQNISLIVAPKDPDTLLVTARDKATGLPLSGVSIELSKGGYDAVQVTGQGFLRQTDWSGGSGQATTTDDTKYLSSDGNVDVSQAGNATLKKVFGDYVSSGTLTSSSFDIGFPATLQQIMWSPQSQPIGGDIEMQIASNNDGGTWDFVGPDGTSGTYYTVGDQNIYSGAPARYVRYKLFLTTTATSTAPNVSDISFTFTSSCTPPGQVSFSGLSSGSYSMTLSKDGYADQTVPVSISSGWQTTDISMQSN